MRRTRFDNAQCPLARTSDLLGDWWSPLVLRELFFGRTRFADLQESLDISKGVLSQRLRRFEDEGIVEREAYQSNPPRYEYVLTEKGQALWEVLAVMWRFGDEWLFDSGAAVELVDTRTGQPVMPVVIDGNSGEFLDLASTRVRRRVSEV